MKTVSIITIALACAGTSGIATAQTQPGSTRGHAPAVGTPAGQSTGKSAGTIRASSGGGKPHAQRTVRDGAKPRPATTHRADSTAGRR